MHRSPVSPVKTTPSKGRLLLVEDHEDIAHVLSIALRMAGYDVQTAETSAEAKEYLNHNAVDLVITDWQLPGGNGEDVCLAAREVDKLMPIIMISAIIGRWDLKVMQCQCDAYLKKPVDLNTLRLTIQRLLNWRLAQKSI